MNNNPTITKIRDSKEKCCYPLCKKTVEWVLEQPIKVENTPVHGKFYTCDEHFDFLYSKARKMVVK